MTSRPEAPVHLAAGKPASEADLIIQRRYRLVKRLMPPRGRVLLDFGCGNGAQTFLFAQHFPLTVGMDVDERHLDVFTREAAKRGLGGRSLAVRYDGFRVPLTDGSVDYAISFEVLEHVESQGEALSELRRVIRPGGTLAISVPNRWWVFETHGAELPLLPWNRVPLFSWLPKRIHDRYARARNYRRREIVGRLEHSGFLVHKSVYITAPMDMVKPPRLQHVLRSTVFRADHTRVPVLATAILAVAARP